MDRRADTDFLVYLSHELRNGLNAMLGHAQLLQSHETIDDQARESVDRIVSAGWHVTGLLDEVHEVVTLEAGAGEVLFERVELAPLLRELAVLVHPLAYKRSITVVVADIPPGAVAVADRRRLTQVALNVLSNAIKYSVAGGEVTLGCDLDDGRRAKITIADTGPGITPERLGGLFEPFERLGAETGVMGGSGIGLALSRRLVELMDGELSVVSEPGAGSIFTVDLPLAPQPHDADLPDPDAVAA
ncbi:MAG: HAMP domain-containing sensor histidine kinase [Thermoleophilaceae bacterium]